MRPPASASPRTRASWSSASEIQRWGLGYDNGEGVAYNPATSQLFIVTDNGDLQTSYLYVYKVQ